ncbi:hypothetical protein AV530_015942 [Patagioenas fasciata monilis]|uniref:Uncharacterized protein n=1 Tax=Patagioenas fasciata monilis TaxID=372326 RepID=A0A1V4KJI5_PATFA|nr:hypothetical protein AV530_015942 [Patagioenas fasciata monilis]
MRWERWFPAQLQPCLCLAMGPAHPAHRLPFPLDLDFSPACSSLYLMQILTCGLTAWLDVGPASSPQTSQALKLRT